MSNPIIEYGQKRDKSLREAAEKEKITLKAELDRLNAKALSEFEQVFKEVLPALSASGVTYSVSITDKAYHSNDRYIIFKCEGYPNCKMDWCGPGHYRFSDNMQYGEWDPELLLGHLYDGMFNQLPF